MAVTNTTIDLEWTAATDNVGVVSYQIFQSTDNVLFTEIHESDGVTLAYTAIGLTPETQYYFKQTAKDAADNQSIYGNTVTATTLADGVGYTYLLDDYPGAVAAYSLQKLSSTAVQGIMVRRDSDDQLVDVQLYDDPNKSIDLDSIIAGGGAGTLGEWVGSASAFVFNWYDQSGSGNTVGQFTEGQQPVLVESGVLVVSNNGKTGIRTYNSRLDHLGTAISVNMDVYSGFHVNEVLSRVEQAVVSIIDSTTNNRYISMCYQSIADTFAIIDRNLSNYQLNTTPPADLNTSFLQTGIKVSLFNRYLWVNSSDIGIASGQLGSLNSSNLYINRLRAQDVFCGDAIYQESIIYMSDQTANRTAIEDNINSRYNIYLTTAEVDAYLIEVNSFPISNEVIEVNGVRSSASDLAVSNLISNGNTVITK